MHVQLNEFPLLEMKHVPLLMHGFDAQGFEVVNVIVGVVEARLKTKRIKKIKTLILFQIETNFKESKINFNLLQIACGETVNVRIPILVFVELKRRPLF
jgi:hypothetical protein